MGVADDKKVAVLGAGMHEWGKWGRPFVEYGLAAMELEAGDSGLRTFVSVQGSLAMSAIHKFGSPDHKQQWLVAWWRVPRKGGFTTEARRTLRKLSCRDCG